ncbi:MAG: class I SAM-dependent methyltransferase [Desulfomonile tiedjei]|nr:class I SAM-dependent methyltransferase [Desulfomonile tiedjei]
MASDHLEWLNSILSCPSTGSPTRYDGSGFVSVGRPSIRFPIEAGILRAFLPVEGDDVAVLMEDFYSHHPFPNYDEMETIGSLLEKSFARRFSDLLNRSIPPLTTVLEAGCGTGQLGNFLSIANRRVLSCDMTWNSLKLGQEFKDRNGLTNVTFAQMNLFRLPLLQESFDVVICTGVLHHTSDPKKGFQGLVRFVKPGGHIIIGLYNSLGRLKNRLLAWLSWIGGERVLAVEPYLRKHPMDEEKRRAWAMDQYRNPHESRHTMDEVLGWFDQAGIRFIRAIPSTIPGDESTWDYRRSLFEPESSGTHLGRIVTQMHQMVNDVEGGLFIMIGKKQ